jgi:hypothetical protein
MHLPKQQSTQSWRSHRPPGLFFFFAASSWWLILSSRRIFEFRLSFSTFYERASIDPRMERAYWQRGDGDS